MKLVIEADGGSRGNPGLSGAGAVVIDGETNKTLREISLPLGIATNNFAEYTALIAALEAASEIDSAAEITVRMDSKLVIEQMAGRWKIKHPDMMALARKAQQLIAGKRVEFVWIPREQNIQADRLANLAMDGAPSVAAAVEFNVSEPSSIRAPRPGETVSTTLIMVRHGRTALTESRRISGGSGENPPLSEVGIKDAQEAARAIAAIGKSGSYSFIPAPSVVIHSPVLRAKQTAELIANHNRLGLEELNELSEIDFGDWDGLTNEEVFAQFEDEYIKWRGSFEVPPPGGESLKDFEKRILEAFRKILESHRGQSVVVVAHVMPIRGLLKIASDSSIAGYWRPNISPASLSIARFWGFEEAEIVCLNSTGHLSS